MKKLHILLLLPLFLWNCSKEEELTGSGVFYSDTIPSEIIHDIVFSSTDEMWMLGSSFDSDADLPPWSSLLPFKMQLVKKENNRYLTYDRIPNAVMMRFDKADNLYLLANKTLNKFNGSRIEVFYDPDLPENGSFTSMVIDDQNRIWLSGIHTGILMYDGEQWNSYTKDNSSMSENSIRFLTTDGETIWALMENQQEILEIKDGQFNMHYLETEQLSNPQFYYLEIDFFGILWLTNQNEILLMYKSGTGLNGPQLISDGYNLAESYSIRNFKADKKGNVFILYNELSTNERKIIRINKKLEVEDIEIPDSIGAARIYTMSFDSQNHLWIGTSAGVFKIETNE